MVCTMDWDFSKIGDILREAAQVPSDAQRSRHDQHPSDWSRSRQDLHRYSGHNVPGQLWNCYKNTKNEKQNSMDLRKKLEGLLRPSMTEERLNELLLLLEQERIQLQRERDERIALGGYRDEEEDDYDEEENAEKSEDEEDDDEEEEEESDELSDPVEQLKITEENI